MRPACLALVILCALAAPAAAFDARDRGFEPGRVGAIVKGTTKPHDLERIYGAANVRREKFSELGGGDLHPGAHIFFDSPDALTVHFSDDGKSIVSVVVLGRNWTGQGGLRVGMSAADLERLHGGPFKFYGFGFDYGGQVLTDRPVFKGMTIFLQPSGDDQAARLELTKPEAELSSSHPAVKRAGLAVSFIDVSLRNIE